MALRDASPRTLTRRRTAMQSLGWRWTSRFWSEPPGPRWSRYFRSMTPRGVPHRHPQLNPGSTMTSRSKSGLWLPTLAVSAAFAIALGPPGCGDGDDGKTGTAAPAAPQARGNTGGGGTTGNAGPRTRGDHRQRGHDRHGGGAAIGGRGARRDRLRRARHGTGRESGHRGASNVPGTRRARGRARRRRRGTGTCIWAAVRRSMGGR